MWLTFGQSAQQKSCAKYSNLPPCKISYFSKAPKYFCLNLFHSSVFQKFLEKRKENFFLRGPNLPHRPNPRAEAARFPFSPSPHCQAGPDALAVPPVSDHSLCVGPTYQRLLPQVPLPCRTRALSSSAIHHCRSPPHHPAACCCCARVSTTCALHCDRLIPSRVELSPHATALCASATYRLPSMRHP
jgi:hypothetical protein